MSRTSARLWALGLLQAILNASLGALCQSLMALATNPALLQDKTFWSIVLAGALPQAAHAAKLYLDQSPIVMIFEPSKAPPVIVVVPPGETPREPPV